MAVSVLPSMPQAKKRAVRSASAPSARCTVFPDPHPARPDGLADQVVALCPDGRHDAYPCICMRSVAGCVEISRG
jgi:hypothetical protein